MKKLNLAMIATALMFSFGCQKEIETQSTNESLINDEENIDMVFKCQPDTCSWYWYNNGGTNYQQGDYCCVVNSAFYNAAYSPFGTVYNPVSDSGMIAYPQVNGLADKYLLMTFFDVIDNNNYTNYPAVSSFINQNMSTLKLYFDPCDLSLLQDSMLFPVMHHYQNINGGGYFEYLRIHEPNTVDLIKVYPVNLH